MTIEVKDMHTPDAERLLAILDKAGQTFEVDYEPLFGELWIICGARLMTRSAIHVFHLNYWLFS